MIGFTSAARFFDLTNGLSHRLLRLDVAVVASSAGRLCIDGTNIDSHLLGVHVLTPLPR